MSMGKIRVLYPMLHYPPVIGGIEQCAKNVAERQPRDIEVFVVTGGVKGVPAREKVKNCFVFRYSPIKLSSFHTSWIYITTSFPFIFFNSFYIAKKYKVDVIHCYGFIGSVIGYVISKLISRPFISTEQGLTEANNSGVRMATKFFRGMVYRRASLCIASSKAVAEEFYGLGVGKVKIIPNGVDLNIFSNKRKDSSNKCTLLTVGRLEKVKGHSHLINAFSEIIKEIPRARLVVIGDGSERKNLERQAMGLGLSDYIEFKGEVEHDQLPPFFNQADVFIMPSLSEGFGIVAIEAMASGLPVIASRVGSLVDIIEHKVTGFTIEPKNSRAIREYVINILKDKDLHRRISDNASRYARKYSWDTIAQKMTVIYKSFTIGEHKI